MARKILPFSLLGLFVLGTTTFLGAQETQSKFNAEIYPKTMGIYKVYPHKLGYRVDYYKSDRSLGTFYAPLSWFEGTSAYGEIVYGTDRTYPYVTFYYKDGAISHFRLYLFQDYYHSSWAYFQDPTKFDDRFGAEALEVEY